MIIHNFIWK